MIYAAANYPILWEITQLEAGNPEILFWRKEEPIKPGSIRPQDDGEADCKTALPIGKSP